ncbi:hypothetical protein ACOSQ4_008372 [Xanthoceras sorbifolium]
MIDESQKFHCPYKDCSGMLVDERGGGEAIVEAECPFCHRFHGFCCLGLRSRQLIGFPHLTPPLVLLPLASSSSDSSTSQTEVARVGVEAAADKPNRTKRL